MEKYLRIRNRLLDVSTPRIMAIVNVTPDSFYSSCKSLSVEEVLACAEKHIDEGADILDIGACSTRPSSTPVSAEDEWSRLKPALCAVRQRWRGIPLSVDTFRADIAREAVACGADIINDVYGGEADEAMFDAVAHCHVPYVLTHSRTLPPCRQGAYDATVSEVLAYLQARLDALRQRGVADVVIDPGFGFGKTVEQNYTLLRQLEVLQVMDAPLLVGVSRKSMFYKPLHAMPADVLPATTAAHLIALQQGANILRVHDVAAAKQAIAVYQYTCPAQTK